jgi:Tfp pilus assembly protein PilF
MLRKQLAMVWALLLICMVPGLAFGDRVARLVGKVVDEQGNPIKGVTVTVTSPQIKSMKEVRTTDKKGIFIVDYDEVDVTYHYRFDAPGFQSMEAEQNWHLLGTQHSEWTMHPGQSAVAAPGAAPPVTTSEPAIEAFNAGVIALQAKDYQTAEKKFTAAVGFDPKLRQGWEALTIVELRLGKYRETAEDAEKAMALGSTDEGVLTARWQAYTNLKDEAKAAEAQKDLQKAGRAAEEAKRVHNDALALQKSGDDAGAFAKYQEALQLDPNLVPSMIGLAETGIKLGKFAEAATAAEDALKIDPKNATALRLNYNACLGLGDKAKLEEALVEMAPIEPTISRDGLLRLAFDAYDANDMKLSKKRFNEALAIDPNYPQAYYYLGLIDVSLGANAEARTNFQRFLQLAPDDPEAPSAREALKYLKP